MISDVLSHQCYRLFDKGVLSHQFWDNLSLYAQSQIIRKINTAVLTMQSCSPESSFKPATKKFTNKYY
jgi:hypothetical protein